MQIDVSLGGYVSSWRFDGSLPWQAWIGDGQWIDDGGLKLLRVPEASYFQAYQRRVRQSLVSSSPGNDTRVFARDENVIPQPEYSVEEWIVRCLGVHDEPREFQRLHEASQLIDHRPTAFVVPLASQSAQETISICQAFIEKVEKAGGYRRPTIVAIVAGETPPLLPFYSFLRGRPDGLRFCDPMLQDAELWRSYMHQRLAWESAGDVRLAESWDQQFGFRKIPIGNDDLFENGLNRAAQASLKAIDTESIGELGAFIANASAEGQSLDPARLATLGDQSLIWQPLESNGHCVAPWAARASLIREPNSPYRHLLRDSLNCRPLVSELLSFCFALESRERQICCTEMADEIFAKDETAKQYQEFLDGAGASPARFYPSECPARMSDIWQFASFGEILAQTRVRSEKTRRQGRHQVRSIRNALAHGHYASWRMLMEARDLQGNLR